MTIALVDVNACFVSCERVFDPTLRGKPVVVLSSNDACVIARSPEAKRLGISMGEPAARLRPFLAQGLILRSSNFTLYADMSQRIMAILATTSPQQRVYSIDEAFLAVPDDIDALTWGDQVRARVLREVGIPTSVGIAPTMTLAKLANETAKGLPRGVAMLPEDPHERLRHLAGHPVAAVWGIGAQTAPKLEAMGIRTAADLALADRARLRATIGVGVARTACELAGEPVLDLDEAVDPPQSITVSRSYSTASTDLDTTRAAIATFAENAAAKARRNHIAATVVAVWICPSDGPDRSGSLSLPVASALTAEIQAAAATVLARMSPRPGTRIRKAGIGLLGLQPEGARQQTFLDPIADRPRAERLQAAIDAINAGEGRHVVRTATTLLSSTWQPSAARMSPRYTTRWEELPVAR